MTPKMPWFRMYTDFLSDPKMIALAFEDQRHFIAILALKSEGVLEQDCDETMLNRIVAQRLWADFAIITEVKKRLIAAGLIYPDWQPVAWGKRQFRSDKDVTGAERQRRFRESQKGNALRNGAVTLPEADTDTDTELLHGACAPVASDAANPLTCPVQKIVDLYHELMPNNPKVRVLDDARRRAISARWKQAAKLKTGPFFYETADKGISAWRDFFEVCNGSDFLTGKVPPGKDRTKPFVADLDFLLSNKGFKGCLENKYHGGAND